MVEITYKESADSESVAIPKIINKLSDEATQATKGSSPSKVLMSNKALNCN
jgi:hypothetical protein